MGDPLLTPALVGAIVSSLLNEVIVAAKGAIAVKKVCKALQKKVDKIVPLLEVVDKNSIIREQAHLDWLEEYNTILVNAQSVLKECLQETRASKWVRLMKVWQWRKLPSRLKDINDQIDEARLNGILTTLGVSIQSSNSIQKQSKSKVDFVTQSTPPLIVGVQKLFKKLKTSILACSTNDKSIVLGLQGRGGVGKTLLAGQLNNDEDIKAKYGPQGILWLTIGLDARIPDLYKTMGKFLNDGVFEEEYAHRNQEDQRTYLRYAFAKKKVFFILDDVWGDQCDHREMMYWLNVASAPGSTTLITTRSMTVFSKVHAEVEVVLLLSNEDSWTLFCVHAFESGSPPPSISEDLAREVCEECQGPPLALKVIGSAMVDKHGMEEWRFALLAFKESKPILDSNVDDELYHRLQLSYNNLKDDVTKTCFLYCAAFPEDYKIHVKDLCKIWITEGLFGVVDVKNGEDVAMSHLEILAKRSMLDWNRGSGYITVHDILRDLAVYIIRLARPDDSAFNCWFESGKVLPSLFAKRSLSKLQRMSFVQSTILEWPNQLHAPHLQVCLLRAMSIGGKGLCIPDEFFFNLGALQYLDLSKNYFDKKLPEMCGLRSLLVLDLQECASLSELPESIGELNSLIELNLWECKSLNVLPQSIGGLKCLTKLDLQGCESLKVLPPSIGGLKCLTELDLGRCQFLSELPESIGELNSLIELNLQECKSLKVLSPSIGVLKCLTKLDLQGCYSLKVLPQSIGSLEVFTKLDLQFCKSLSELPKSMNKLTALMRLNLQGCESLKVLPPNIGGLKCLTKLDLQGCSSLSELPESIGKLNSLMELNLQRCKSLKVLPPSIGDLKCLTKLDLRGCYSLKVLPQSIGSLEVFTKLDLQFCKSLSELPKSIDRLTSLMELNLQGCESLKVLPPNIGGLKCLTMLKLQGCSSLSELPKSINKLNSLMRLNLQGCESLKVLSPSIGGLKCLTKLDLQGCSSLSELPESIDELNSLMELNLQGCKSLKVLPPSIGSLKCLKKLDLGWCQFLSELPESIDELKSLLELDLQGCYSLKVLPPSIGDLKCLTSLILGGCSSLSELPESIGELNSLIELDLRGCGSLKVLPPSIGGLKCLIKGGPRRFSILN